MEMTTVVVVLIIDMLARMLRQPPFVSCVMIQLFDVSLHARKVYVNVAAVGIFWKRTGRGSHIRTLVQQTVATVLLELVLDPEKGAPHLRPYCLLRGSSHGPIVCMWYIQWV